MGEGSLTRSPPAPSLAPPLSLHSFGEGRGRSVPQVPRSAPPGGKLPSSWLGLAGGAGLRPWGESKRERVLGVIPSYLRAPFASTAPRPPALPRN